jgi:hypothetical protein
MKIVKTDGQILETSKAPNLLRLIDLSPGDIFRYARGKVDNIYIKGLTSSFLLTANTEYQDLHVSRIGSFHQDDDFDYELTDHEYRAQRNASPIVIRYPDAQLILGEEETERPPKKEEPSD